ncbi:MAG: formylmethanofuran dehydrogenase subunit C [Planctomycetota bacterium]
MPLVLTLRESPSIPIEVDAVRVEIVREQTVNQVRATLIQHGNRREPLGEFFDVTGSASDDQQIVWAGDCSRAKRIGEKHSCGQMLIEGDAGMHLGAEMTGGEITVRGRVADWAGAEMRGGRLRIEGNAGNCLGAGYRGATRGMTGGEILVSGSAGDEVGTALRRGLIAVAGSVGHAAGFGMIAGSLMFFGDVGRHIGAGMKRGSISLFSTPCRAELLPSFHYACSDRPTFLAIYLRHLQQLGFALPDGCCNANYDRYCGDLIELGKGEILVRRDE